MNIKEIRAKYPQYSDMSDTDLASALHKKFYADMPFDQFSAKIGLASKAAPVDPSQAIGEAQAIPEARYMGMDFKGEYGNGFSPAAAIIGTGRLADRLNQGVDAAKTAANFAVQRLIPGMDGGQKALDELMAQREREAEKTRQFEKLETVNPGSTQIGQIAPLLPLGPKAMMVAAGAEYGSPQERAMRVAAVAAGNKLATVAGKAAASKAENLAAKGVANREKDAVIASLKDRGYKALPSEAGGNLPGRLMEGASGQIKAKQAMQAANQPLTDRIALEEAGGAVEATYKALKEARAKAFEDGYKPLLDLWGDKVRLKPSESFKAKVSSITSRSDNASRAFGDAVKSDVSALVDSVKQAKPFSVSEALDTVSIWREKASDAYRLGNRDMGKAYRKLAEALEDELGAHLSRSKNADLLKGYQQARKTIAKNFDVEAALVEGRGVSAEKLAAAYRKNPDKFSGGLKEVAQAGTYLKDSAKLPVQGGNLPVSALDAWGASLGQMGGTIASLMTGNPIPAMIPLATIGGRVGARKALQTGFGQKAFATPNYSPGMLLQAERKLLENEFAPQAGGLLGYYFTR